MWTGKQQMTLETGGILRFWVHQKLARELFEELHLMDCQAFNKVAWKQVHSALHSVPRLFQLWACKRFTNIAATNERDAR